MRIFCNILCILKNFYCIRRRTHSWPPVHAPSLIRAAWINTRESNGLALSYMSQLVTLRGPVCAAGGPPLLPGMCETYHNNRSTPRLLSDAHLLPFPSSSLCLTLTSLLSFSPCSVSLYRPSHITGTETSVCKHAWSHSVKCVDVNQRPSGGGEREVCRVAGGEVSRAVQGAAACWGQQDEHMRGGWHETQRWEKMRHRWADPFNLWLNECRKNKAHFQTFLPAFFSVKANYLDRSNNVTFMIIA